MPVEKVAPSIRRILAPNPSPWTLEGTNTYLIGESSVYVLDPGPSIQSHLDEIVETAGVISGILLTHSHPDHAESVQELAARTDAPILEPEVLDIDGATLRPVATPGHSSDHFCYLLEERGILFSGDHVLGRGTTVVAYPDGDMRAYLASLARVKELSPNSILPGHGPTIDDPAPVLEFYGKHRLQREAKVRAALSKEPRPIGEILGLAYDDVQQEVLPAAELSLRAHLRKLQEDGEAAVEGDSWHLR